MVGRTPGLRGKEDWEGLLVNGEKMHSRHSGEAKRLTVAAQVSGSMPKQYLGDLTKCSDSCHSHSVTQYCLAHVGLLFLSFLQQWLFCAGQTPERSPLVASRSVWPSAHPAPSLISLLLRL